MKSSKAFEELVTVFHSYNFHKQVLKEEIGKGNVLLRIYTFLEITL